MSHEDKNLALPESPNHRRLWQGQGQTAIPRNLTRPEAEKTMSKDIIQKKLDALLNHLFSRGALNKKCNCGDVYEDQILFAALLVVLGAKPGSNKIFEFTGDKFHLKETCCFNGRDGEELEQYWRDFVDEVVSLVGE